jgi:subtilisin family serine protease
VGWNVSPSDQTENEFELWYAGASALAIELIAPTGQSLATVQAGASGTILANGEPAIFIANRLDDPNNGDNMIGIYMTELAPGGRWVVRLHGDANLATPFHAWVERDDAGQSSFDAPTDNGYTVGSISCGHETIVVGSYDGHKSTLPLSWFSSAGPTRDGRQKPEVSAPGHAVFAAASRTRTGTTRMSGTSMAAPCVTGLAALVLAEAKARNRSLAIADIRDAVISAARRNPPAGTVWDNRYGMGRVSANASVARAMTAPQPIAATRKPAKPAKPTGRGVQAPAMPSSPIAARTTGRGVQPPAMPAAVPPAAKAKPHGAKRQPRRV